MLIRKFTVAVVAAVVLLVAAPAGATRLRLASAWTAYGDALRAAAPTFPKASATLLEAADLCERPALLPIHDFQDYCNGVNTANVNLILETPAPGVGMHQKGNNIGGFRVGVGFVLNLTTSSRMTITTFDREAGICAGTFQFQALNGSGQGNGEFVFRIVEQ